MRARDFEVLEPASTLTRHRDSSAAIFLCSSVRQHVLQSQQAAGSRQQANQLRWSHCTVYHVWAREAGGGRSDAEYACVRGRVQRRRVRRVVAEDA